MQREKNKMMEIILAIILGSAFGFSIHRVGASNPSGIINMLRLKDMHLMRVILLSIAISSAIIFVGISLGIVDATHLSIKTMSWGVIVGGMIFGLGWGIAGYCPGTAVCAISEGRKDARFFILGALLGSLIYMIIFQYVEGSFLLDSLWGGKALLADVTPKNETAIVSVVPAIITVISISVIFTVIAYFLPTAKEPDSL